MRWRLCLLLAVMGGAVMAGDPPIRLPVIEQPTPVVPPDTPVKLTGEKLFIIDSDLPLIVLSSPNGLLKVTEEAGPIRIRGVFVDGNGKVQTRNYKGKHVYTVEVADGRSGLAELIIVPVGVKAESEVIRRLIDANSGPQPPPPDPKPEPNPNPKPDPKPAEPQEVWVIVVEETAQRTVDTAKVLNDTKFWNGLVARGHRFRLFDKDAPEAAGFASQMPSLPGVLVMAKDGKKLYAGKLPKTVAELEDTLKKVGAK